VALRAGGSYGFGTANSLRGVNFTGFSDADRASQDANIFQLFGEAGYDFDLHGATLEPFVGLAWTQINMGAFSETGGSSALSGRSRDMSTGYSVLGAQLFTGEADFLGGTLSPLLRAGWQHAFTSTVASRAVTFISTTQNFTVLGTPLETDRAMLDVGATLGLGKDTQVSLGYSGMLGSHTTDHAIRLMGVVKL
jgi:outer membrane autotransporter protein